MRTLLRKLKQGETFTLFIQAMHRYNKVGCEESLEKAIKSCKNKDIKDYLIKNWKSDTSKFGLYARQHSPLLMQHTSSNAVENYHKVIKMDCDSKDSFITTIKKLNKHLKVKLAEISKVKLQFKTLNLSICDFYPILKRFTLPFQRFFIF